MQPWFIVTERFGPHRGDEWRRYVEWAQLPQLTEVVSLDGMLCPDVIHEIRDEDWPHIVNESYMLDYFTDLDYLLRRCGTVAGRNLLCVFRNPQRQPVPPDTPHAFQFEGYDLVDTGGGVSALTNCGGFPLAFANDELNAHGLLGTLERAQSVQRALRQLYPEEHHADCHVWALFRAREPGASAPG